MVAMEVIAGKIIADMALKTRLAQCISKCREQYLNMNRL